MSFEATQNTIISRFNTEVATPQSLTVAWENVNFTPPSNAIWARVTIREGESAQADIGSTHHRRRTPGVCIVQLFAPINKGTKDVIELADIVADKMSLASVSGVRFQMAYLDRAGQQGQEYQLNVVCPFEADDLVEVK